MQSLDTPISQIEAKDGNCLVTAEDFERCIELPVLAPCLKLRELGIRTTASTANANNIGYEAALSIDRKTLAAVNDQRLLKLERLYPDNVTSCADWFQLSVPIPSGDTTAREISDFFNGLVDKAELLPQPAFFMEMGDLGNYLTSHSAFSAALAEILSVPIDADGGMSVSEKTADRIDEIMHYIGAAFEQDEESGYLTLKPENLSAEELENLQAYMGIHIDGQTLQVYPSTEAADYHKECERRKAPATDNRIRPTQMGGPGL